MTENTSKLAPSDASTPVLVSGRLNAVLPARISVAVASLHDSTETAMLLGAVLHGCEQPDCPVIHFLSAYAGEGCGSLAFDVALLAARTSGKRTLLLSLNAASGSNYSQLAQKAVVSVESFFRAEKPQVSPLVELEGTSLVYAEFSKTVPGMASSANIDLLRELLISLRLNFDLIILASEAALSTSLSTTLGAAVDGAVLVVEAERTRSPVIADLIEQIRAHGGRILGTVLTRRRFYIPRPIYGLFFGDHRS